MFRLRKVRKLDKIVDCHHELNLNNSFEFETMPEWGKGHLASKRNKDNLSRTQQMYKWEMGAGTISYE